MQRGDEPCQRLQRVGDAAAMTAGMEVLGGAGQREFQRREPAIGNRDGRLVGPPHGAVGRQHEIGLQLVGMGAHEILEMRAAELLLALDHQLEVDRQPACGLEIGLRRLDRNQHRPLVVRDAAGVEAVVADLWRERRAEPFLQRVGRLHVVVPVHQDGRLAGRTQPAACHDRVAGGRADLHLVEPGAAHALRHPFRRFLDVCGVGRVGADAGDAGELDQLRQGLVAAAPRIGLRIHRYLPPSTPRTWPVIQPARSEAKNSTALAMSDGLPSRFSAIDSTRRRWPSSR